MAQNRTVIQPGTVLNNTYVVQKPLGSGGGGAIYLAYHTHLQKHVAIKKIHEVGMVPEEILRREADILKNLRHTYLPQVFDFLVMPSGVYTVMDYIPGWSLKELLDSGHKFSEKEIVKYGAQLCDALAYLHTRKPAIIHGDIKPANIMVTPEGNIVLIDFNISAFTSSDGKAYTFGYSAGYAAPEQYAEYKRLTSMSATSTDSSAELSKGIAVDYRTDIYSVGATLYHMLTGMKVTQAPKGEVLTNAGDGLVFILNKALNENPSKRYANASQMLEAFRNIYKLDKRYKSMEARRTVLQIAFIFAAAIGALMLYMGVRKNKEVLVERYKGYIEKMETARAEGDYDEFENCYNSALEIDSVSIDAYSERADMLFETQDYEGDIDYINNTVFNVEGLEFNNDIGYIYYILGLCYFETEDYARANNAYQNALNYGASDGNIYVQYAIALARTGDIDDAEAKLAEAKSRNANNSLVELTEGEIKLALTKYDEAITSFDNCIAGAETEYVLMRAFFMKADTYSEKASKQADNDAAIENYRLAAGVVDDAMKVLPASYRNALLQRQAQAYINANNLSNDNADAYAAIKSLQGIVDTGMADFTVYNNIVIMYWNCGELDEAGRLLAEIEDKFSNRYEYYMRRALHEIMVQNQAAAENVNYDNFKIYYDKAKELYEGKEPDIEMGQLDSLYNELVDAGVF